MDLMHLKIDSPEGKSHAGTKVELDGEQITTSLTGIDLHVGLDYSVVTATLAVFTRAQFEGKARPILSEETQTLLKRLGWTPPDA